MKSANKEQVDAVASAICKSKLSDEDVLRLVDFGFASGSPDIAISILECLKQSGQYLLIPAKFLISLLSMDAYSSEDKVKILNKCFEFKMDNKAFESVVTIIFAIMHLQHRTENQFFRVCLRKLHHSRRTRWKLMC